MKTTILALVLFTTACTTGDNQQHWCPVRDVNTCNEVLDADICVGPVCTYPWNGPDLAFPYCISNALDRDGIDNAGDNGSGYQMIDGNWFEHDVTGVDCEDGFYEP